MRILRGHSSTDVSYRGFALFVLGLIISTFLGGAIRTVLNSTAIQKRFLEEARKKWPDVSIEIGKMQGQLSRGIWPGLVFKFNKIHLIKKSCTGDSVDVEFDELYAPIKIMSLWSGKPRLGELEGGHLKVKIFKSACAQDVESSVAVAPPSTELLTQKSKPRLNLNWLPLRNLADGISIKTIELISEAEPNLKSIVTNFELELDDNLELNADLEIRKALQFSSLSHRLSIHVEATEKMAEARLRGKLKEGQLDWKIQVNLAEQSFHQELVVKQLPIKDVFSELLKAGLTTQEFSLRSLWLSCRVTQSGQLSDWRAGPLDLQDCKLNGGTGTIELSEGQLSLGEKRFVKPAKLVVTNLQLAPLIEALNRDQMPQVFSNLGSWSGQVEVTSEEDWKIEGLLSGFEIIVSSQSVRGKQIITSLKTELENAPSGVRGKISHLEFAGGNSDGEILLNLDQKMKSGAITFNFKNVLPSENIQRLLLGGSVKAMALVGQGKLLDGDLESFEGKASAEELVGKGWQLMGAGLQVTFKNKQAAVKVNAKRFEAGPKWSQFLAFGSVYGENPEEKIVWTEPNAQLIVSEKGGDLVSLVLNDLGRKLRMVAKGNWLRDRDFVGSLIVYNSGAALARKNYSVLGREYQLSITSD